VFHEFNSSWTLASYLLRENMLVTPLTMEDLPREEHFEEGGGSI